MGEGNKIRKPASSEATADVSGGRVCVVANRGSTDELLKIVGGEMKLQEHHVAKGRGEEIEDCVVSGFNDKMGGSGEEVDIVLEDREVVVTGDVGSVAVDEVEQTVTDRRESNIWLTYATVEEG